MFSKTKILKNSQSCLTAVQIVSEDKANMECDARRLVLELLWWAQPTGLTVWTMLCSGLDGLTACCMCLLLTLQHDTLYWKYIRARLLLLQM